jgi:hypothetical protein
MQIAGLNSMMRHGRPLCVTGRVTTFQNSEMFCDVKRTDSLDYPHESTQQRREPA